MMQRGLTLRAGAPLPNIAGTRAPLANRLLRGRPAASAPQLLGGLFSLCADAHRLTSSLALHAAAGRARGLNEDERLRLKQETMREHVRRIWLDWPRLLAADAQPDPASIALLQACPLVAAQGGDMAAWVAEAVLGEAVHAWLARWQRDARGTLSAWSGDAQTLPARLLAQVRNPAERLQVRSRPLRSPAGEAGLRAIAAALDSDAGFETMPQLGGAACDSGCWARVAADTAIEAGDAWLRLGARIAELAALSVAPDDAAPLTAGALQLGDGDGIAWCEMARGMLLHRVKLREAGATVAEYRVVAPTEWNFHPQGLAAQMIMQARDARDASIAAAAFDPCVAFEVEMADA